MRKYFLTAMVVVAMGIIAPSALALEKTIAPVEDLDPGWNATNTIRVQYYNTCLGYIWIWNQWAYVGDGGETFGATYSLGCVGAVVSQTQLAFYNALPQGYGYTGTISVLDGTSCNSPVLATQVYNPVTGTSFVLHTWNVPVADPFMVTLDMSSPDTLLSNTGGIALDIVNVLNLAGGPSIDPCVVCNVAGRTPHTYWFGVGGSICSGTALTFAPTACVPSEMQILTDLKTCNPTSVDAVSWGQIKALYQ